uniref:AlNc14C303G10402 protein n=1 Tax=Albugo laibachii Nc14 TaxID=890382 RepID=F0WVR3_9STRA|nr:AlNc14C303G10402 [Albugo laibachii Nc14]|eukprot:CCA25509.1 AlNc14C303G10402 [Albugo laibachii Nc14]
MEYKPNTPAEAVFIAEKHETLVNREKPSVDILSGKLQSELALLRDNNQSEDQIKQRIRETWQSLSPMQMDELLLKLLRQIHFYQNQRDQVRELGETLATQLLEQQHLETHAVRSCKNCERREMPRLVRMHQRFLLFSVMYLTCS